MLLFQFPSNRLFHPVNVMYALIVGGLLPIAAEVLKPKTAAMPSVLMI